MAFGSSTILSSCLGDRWLKIKSRPQSAKTSLSIKVNIFLEAIFTKSRRETVNVATDRLLYLYFFSLFFQPTPSARNARDKESEHPDRRPQAWLCGHEDRSLPLGKDKTELRGNAKRLVSHGHRGKSCSWRQLLTDSNFKIKCYIFTYLKIQV